MKPRIAKSMPEHNRRERPDMSSSHLANVRKLPCLSCGSEPAGEANHLLHADHGPNGRGLNRKQSDRWAVPADRKCHAAVTDVGDDDPTKAIEARIAYEIARAEMCEAQVKLDLFIGRIATR